MKTRKVHQIGTSLYVTIPADAARRLEIHAGDEVEVQEVDGGLMVRRVPITAAEIFASWEPLTELGNFTLAETVELIREGREERMRELDERIDRLSKK
ncbi:MAG: AbrB/MazE/SpoVT family DNA-binding domain-containing protein [Candidatus Dormibacteraceae bacterium]